MGIGRDMRRLCNELVGGLTLPAPAAPEELYRALCDAMSRRRGRPVHFRTAVFPPGTASGLWLDLTDRDVVVVEERTAPGHQLVILGHELWHMQADHSGHHVDGVGAATRLLLEDTDREALQAAVQRVAARTRFDHAEERDAESFGLLLASKCRAMLAGSAVRGPVQRDGVAGRIGASLGYPGPQG
ncbi:toxin-antitoxin system, toxin component [Streptomyces actinomycinicus]|uniref:Toxin-antitoxin system, toxin component n=1 Tax=Streptomyces actinomycinicus TaxID=1695166 RepID=A0A937JPU5_9ACTN|nr:toxin-antitoxin system, toxin component [Streptomyces actinomycinicus]MBL1086020.1 toxin-antitoxin system, toxin component [Streptomyces actinomycinicus]